MASTPYQLDFVTPGSFPWLASMRKQIRHNLNFLMYPLRRPHTLHRFVLRVMYFCVRSDFSIAAFLAIVPLRSAYFRNGMPRRASRLRASWSVLAVVTTAMFMPLTFSILS